MHSLITIRYSTQLYPTPQLRLCIPPTQLLLVLQHEPGWSLKTHCHLLERFLIIYNAVKHDPSPEAASGPSAHYGKKKQKQKKQCINTSRVGGCDGFSRCVYTSWELNHLTVGPCIPLSGIPATNHHYNINKTANKAKPPGGTSATSVAVRFESTHHKRAFSGRRLA